MKAIVTNELKIYRFAHLSRQSHISHFVTTRRGGVSQQSYESLNLGEFCGDDPEAVSINRHRLADALFIKSEKLFAPCQVHGQEILRIDSSFLSLPDKEQRKRMRGMDALITNQPEICIAVSTADCVPVLIYSPEKSIVAAVHAGWRGTVMQIVKKTVWHMEKMFDCNVQALFAGIGPSIGQENFEVGEEVVDAFASSGQDMQKLLYRHPATHKAHIDLWKANQSQLEEAGIPSEQIEIAGLCTVKESTDFFSARRSGILSGRMLSGIWLK